MILLVFAQGGFPHLSPSFFKLMLSAAIIDFAAFILVFEGIRRSNVSLISPLASFSPVFTTFIAIFTLNEIPSLYRFFGVFVITAGAYLLQISEVKKGILEPIKKLISDQGVRLYFAGFFLWAITPIFQKKAIFETNPTLPLMASLMGLFFVFCFVSPLALRKVDKIITGVRNHYKLFIIIGIFGALSQFAAYQAFSLANVGYVSAIFRLSGVFGVLGGAIFLKEKKFKEKIIGAAIMLAGTFILVI
jgi:drug/metabolite transporter (DMT)-like permease